MRMSRVPLLLSLLVVVVLVAAGPGTRFGVWSFRVGLQMLRWAAYGGVAAAAIALLFLIVPRLRAGASGGLAIALLLALVAFLVPWEFAQKARRLPLIHDVTTDPADPPAFVAVLPLRASALNPAEYGGAEIAAAQRQGYPDIQPLVLSQPPADSFERALAAARDMGWEIVASDPAAGRIEATATTLWFGFKDDVVVRVKPEGTGTRIDVRSLSRVGKSDVGANAQRIRNYLAKLRGA